MTIQFACTKCSTVLEAPDNFAGKQGKCSKCGVLNVIPRQTPPASLAPAQSSKQFKLAFASFSGAPRGRARRFGIATLTKGHMRMELYKTPIFTGYVQAVVDIFTNTEEVVEIDLRQFRIVRLSWENRICLMPRNGKEGFFFYPTQLGSRELTELIQALEVASGEPVVTEDVLHNKQWAIVLGVLFVVGMLIAGIIKLIRG